MSFSFSAQAIEVGYVVPMLVGIQKAFAWATAFAAVFAFYAHAVFGLPSYQVTPVSAAAVAVGLLGMAYFGFLERQYQLTASPARHASSFLLTIALLLAFASTVAHAFADEVLRVRFENGLLGISGGVRL